MTYFSRRQKKVLTKFHDYKKLNNNSQCFRHCCCLYLWTTSYLRWSILFEIKAKIYFLFDKPPLWFMVDGRNKFLLGQSNHSKNWKSCSLLQGNLVPDRVDGSKLIFVLDSFLYTHKILIFIWHHSKMENILKVWSRYHPWAL